jgi:hypothetical protein
MRSRTGTILFSPHRQRIVGGRVFIIGNSLFGTAMRGYAALRSRMTKPISSKETEAVSVENGLRAIKRRG